MPLTIFETSDCRKVEWSGMAYEREPPGQIRATVYVFSHVRNTSEIVKKSSYTHLVTSPGSAQFNR